MSAPLVSIALCTYNGARYLRQQLNSLLAQTYTLIEIVAVDDRSTDETQSILAEYAAHFKQLQVHVNPQNLGYVKNFEKAIGCCTGAYIALCDQDDIWAPDKIELLVKNIGNSMLIYHDSVFIDEAGQPMNSKLSDVRNFYAGSNANIFLMENCVSGHAMLFKRDLLQYFAGFNQTIIHDWWLAYIACNNGGVSYMANTLVQYRQHQQANTNILRQDRGEEKADPLEKIERQRDITRAFAQYPHNTDAAFKQRLLELMEQRMRSYFSFGLFWFIYRNRHTLLFIQKKSVLSKFNFALKHAWGYKLKELFN